MADTRDITIKVRLTDIDRETLALAAKYEGLDVSTYVRRLAIGHALRELREIASELPEEQSKAVQEVIGRQLQAGAWVIPK